MQFLYLYLISIPVFILGDLLWLGFFAKDFYQNRLGYLLGPVNWSVAVVFYAVFLFGLTFFVINPAVVEHNFMKALTWGALFGLVTYATYDLTNHATIKDWPAIVSVVDIAWGAALGAIVASVTFLIYTNFFPG